MNLKKLIKSKRFIVLSISTLLLSAIIGYFIFKSKNQPNVSITSTPLTEKELNPTDSQSYHSALQKWLRESPIQGDTFYTGDEIRGKLGKSNRTLYDVKGNTHSYVYNEGIFYDDWQIDGKDCRRKYENKLHTTPPPTPPKDIKIDYYNTGAVNE
ncbi:hypothetical protein [Candidatus Phytoplasma pruni]|uniref:Uncharacterized protein n=1 Tax=Candidatus Phytoplasma pruni TaxID=479893 RepID=A0A851HFX3_9MOLU|nr:hypothetical protein [Candidatus Phytoplasma pruni]NWN45530.1 hypothetical protein [Candidatus Phytoplasma pruni]